MPKKSPMKWDVLEQELYAAGADPAEVEAGARRLLAVARGYQLAEAAQSAQSAAAGDRCPHGR
jgi:hypothetical protein